MALGAAPRHTDHPPKPPGLSHVLQRTDNTEVTRFHWDMVQGCPSTTSYRPTKNIQDVPSSRSPRTSPGHRRVQRGPDQESQAGEPMCDTGNTFPLPPGSCRHPAFFLRSFDSNVWHLRGISLEQETCLPLPCSRQLVLLVTELTESRNRNSLRGLGPPEPVPESSTPPPQPLCAAHASPLVGDSRSSERATQATPTLSPALGAPSLQSLTWSRTPGCGILGRQLRYMTLPS